MSQSQQVLDHVSDVNGVALVRLLAAHPAPAFVKQATFDFIVPDAAAPATVFADQKTRRFPCHNKAATWLSAVYFADQRESYPPAEAARVQAELTKLAEYWGVSDDVEALIATTAAAQEKTASALSDADYAYVWVGDDGEVKSRFWPVTNAVQVKAAAEALYKARDTMPFADRLTIATKIREKAAEFGAGLGAELDNYIEKQAGMGVCDAGEVVRMVEGRARLATNPTLRGYMWKMAEGIRTEPATALHPEGLIKLAECLDQADQLMGLVGKYTDLIPRPEDVLFSVTYNQVKSATDSAVSLQTGSIYDRNDFAKVALEDIQALMGSSFADEVSHGLKIDPMKLAEHAEALPRPDAETLEKIFKSAGVPALHKAASFEAMDPTDVEALAGQY